MNPVLYLIMRNDIPSMNPGKLAAQAAHVANAFEYEFNKSGPAKKYLGKLYKEWKNQTKQGFGTTITLAGGWVDIARNQYGYREGHFTGGVYDPTYPCLIPIEVARDLQSHGLGKLVHIGENNAVYLRHELVGGYVFGNKDHPGVIGAVGELELYP